MSPAYRDQLTLRELKERAQQLHKLLMECVVCPRECRAHRMAGRIGVCRSSDRPFVSQAGPHYGEEPPLVGWGGSGTIFFARCNLWCLYCQNYDISHLDIGREVSTSELAESMLALQRRGCHNINLVTPTHFAPQIAEALVMAVQGGLQIPLVYNCGGYESVNTLRLLEGMIDIYMPDIKYSNNVNARRYSGVKNYWEVAQAAIREMHRQVGDLKLDANGIAQRGLLIRHLILPNDLAGSQAILDFVANEVSRDSYINLMDQYRPAFKANHFPELNRRITSKEFLQTVTHARSLGLHRGFLEE